MFIFYFLIELQFKDMRFNIFFWKLERKSRGNKWNRELSSKLSYIKNQKCLFYFQIRMWFKYIHTF